MAKCQLVPKGPNGLDSELFKHFYETEGRDEAIYAYGLVRSKEFKEFVGDWENDLDNYAGELNKSHEPTVKDVLRYINKVEFYNDMGQPSTQSAEPKYQRLIEAKTIEFKENSQALSEANKKKNESETPLQKHMAIKEIQALRDKHYELEQDMYDISRLSALEDIDKYAEKDMAELEKIFNQTKVTDADLQRAQRIAELWTKAGDFSGKDHLFLDDVELESVHEGDLKEITDKFTSWAQKAMSYTHKHIIPMSEKLIGEGQKDTFGKDTKFDPDAAINDKDLLTSNFMDISETNSVLLQGMAYWVKEANYLAHQEADKIFKEIEELAKDLTSAEFKLLQQTQSNTDSRLTGNITHRFSQSYFEKMSMLKRNLAKQVMDKKVKDKESFNHLVQVYKRFYKAKSMNQIVVDPRILFYDATYFDGKKPTKEQKEKHKAHLKKHLGEKGAERFIKSAKEKLESYAFEHEVKGLELDEKYADEIAGGDRAGRDLELNRWIANNSPYLQAGHIVDGYKPSTLSGVIARPENEFFLSTAPKRTDFNGNNTGYYDEKFAQIEGNEKLYEFYNYYLDTLKKIRRFLPGFQTGHMQLNSLPTIKKTIIEEYQRDGMAIGLAPLMDALSRATRTDDLTTVAGDLDPLTGEPRNELQTQFLQDTNKEVSDYVKRMVIQHLQENNKRPSKEQEREWRRAKQDELAGEKSFDFVKVLKAYSMMGLSYKHKAVIANQMRIAHQIVDNQFEATTNAAGAPMKTLFGNVLKKSKSLKNTKSMVDYFMDTAFWGYTKNKPEGQVMGKTYTSKEGQEKKEIEKAMTKNEKDLEDGTITQTEYEARQDVLQDQLDVLGGVRTASKYGDLALKYVGLKGLGWNVFASLGNLGFGFISNIIESADGRQFNTKEYFKAMYMIRHSIGKNYTFNQHHKNSGTANKIRTLMDRLDVLKELRNELYETSESSSKYKKATKNFKWILDPYAPQARSEYINQAAIMVSMMLHKKVKINGEEKTLWDAYDDQGQLKEGVEYTKEEEFKLKVKVDKMIKAAHGNYDTLDAPMKIKQVFLGRAFSQFRSWAFMGFANRFQGEFRDHALEMTRKGRYRSVFPFIKEVTKMMKEDGGIEGTTFILKQLLKKATFGGYNAEFNRMDGLSEIDRVNMRKNLMELVVYLSMAAFGLMLRALAKGMDDDDPERDALYFSINLLSRLQTDILFYINPVEFEKLQRNALPIFSLVSDSAKAYTHAKHLAQGYDDVLRSGPNKHQSKAGRAALKILPGPVQWYKIQAASQMLYEKDPAVKKKDGKVPWWKAFWSNNTNTLEGYRLD